MDGVKASAWCRACDFAFCKDHVGEHAGVCSRPLPADYGREDLKQAVRDERAELDHLECSVCSGLLSVLRPKGAS